MNTSKHPVAAGARKMGHFNDAMSDAPYHNTRHQFAPRNTLCKKCDKLFKRSDVVKGLCIWCWYDQGIDFSESDIEKAG